VVLKGLEEFREHLGGELTLTLLRDIGVGVEVHEMDGALVEQSIAWLEAGQGMDASVAAFSRSSSRKRGPRDVAVARLGSRLRGNER
jgi:hypothetical protein